MTKEPFIQPRFQGPRFEEHTLPLSAAKDLAAYEELLLELAKHLFRQKEQGRTRVPKGFASGFSLHLERIDEGSTKSVLVAMMSAAQLFTHLPAEITEAREMINAVIATEEGQPLPADFPKELYSYFNRVGRSLKEGESIEWASESATNKSVLTRGKRIRLARAHRETYEDEADVMAKVEELDAKKKTGILRVSEKEAVPFVFGDPFFAELKEALGNDRVHVRLKGIGVFDINDRLSTIIEIDQLETVLHYALVSAIDGLLSLKDGWLEGSGVAPSSENLSWLTNEVVKSLPETLEYPSVVPTQEGNVVFEWIRPHARIELEINFDGRRLELYSSNIATDTFVEESFGLDHWGEAYTRIAELLVS